MEASHPDERQLTRPREKEENFSDGREEPPRKVLRSEPSLCDASGKLPVPGMFMKFSEILAILRNAENYLELLPAGEKSNAFYIINDSENIKRRQRRWNASYPDDSGPWDSSRYQSYCQYIDVTRKNTLRLRLKDGQFWHRYQSSNWKLVNPQPDPKNLIRVHRYYTTLKGNANYRRRITSVSGKEFNNLALVEYAGVKSTPSKGTRRLQTDPKVPEKVSEKVKCRRTRQIFKEVLKDGKHGTPKNIKQVPNIQYSAARRKQKKKRHIHPKVLNKIHENISDRPVQCDDDDVLKDIFSPPRNMQQLCDTKDSAARRKQEKLLSRVPDEKQILLTMLAENATVQSVINRKDKSPCVILYSDEQFSDMKRNLECEAVLGVDCSHKFGDCFVTMTVYLNSRALHKETYEPLLYLGPVFLHWDQEFLTYVYFFSHIMDKLEDIEPNFEVKLGSESNLSLFKALKYYFPTSEQIVNCHHLKETVIRELPGVLGGKRKECSLILGKIFGSDGIVSSPTLCVFENRIVSLVSYFDKYYRFKTYFGRLQLLLYRYVCEPQERGVSQRLWLNGSDEVLNDYLKVIIKERPHKLPELMEKICNMISHLMMKVENV